MHPYNAVHVVRIPGAPEEDRLGLAIARTLQARALTGLTLNQGQGTYDYGGGLAACEIKKLDFERNTRVLIAEEIERQLNTPFQLAGPFSPFRFFVAPAEDSFALGLVYLHAVADAESVVHLVKDITRDYTMREERDRDDAPKPTPPGRGNSLLSQAGVFARKLAALPWFIREMRCSSRPPCRDAEDLNNKFALFAVPPRRLLRLVATAKSWGITVNDLLLALLLRACAQLATGRERAARRKNISVGCIVNTRKEVAGANGGRFGLSLGSFVITHAVPKEMELKELAKDIGRMTLRVKRKRLYLATGLELALGRSALRFFPEARRKKLYQKHYPLWGGLTNMNINSLWQSREGDKPLDYFRAVSTGPVTPMVISFTTAGEAANIGLSYRSAVFSAEAIEHLARCFLEPSDLEVCP